MGDKHSNLPFQSENGFPFKQITLLGMDIYSNKRQPEKAPSPILTTLLGITMLVKEVHVENAKSTWSLFGQRGYKNNM